MRCGLLRPMIPRRGVSISLSVCHAHALCKTAERIEGGPDLAGASLGPKKCTIIDEGGSEANVGIRCGLRQITVASS